MYPINTFVQIFRMNKLKALFNWSTGKDSALALYYALKSAEFSVEKLITTVSEEYKRVSMHGVSKELLMKQAEQLNLPLHQISIPTDASMKSYNSIMSEELSGLRDEGYDYSIFGDIFLEDLRIYREEKLSEVGLKAVFPLWKRSTKELINEFLSLGFKAITVSVDANLLDDSFVGVELNEDFFNRLPKNVDVCGENGEFHTFVFDGPIFKETIDFTIGKKVLKHYAKSANSNWESKFWYCDLES